jgi:NAD(P)-dependent dehydrogenase (short-subunit alcohol dehydrogenase family)
MKTALVTGANRGLGFETARELARAGFKVYFSARSEEKAKFAIDEFAKENLSTEFVKIDVTKTNDIRAFHARLKESGENLDVLINNAGVFLESLHEAGDESSILRVDPVIILKTIETNTVGPIKLIQSLAPLMLEAGGGRIINISSGMGAFSEMEGLFPGYRVSKTALNSVTKICHEEFKDSNIIVNSVCPGWCRTDMGGDNAVRSALEGVETTVWLATTDNPPRGKLLRDKEVIEW